MWSSQKDSAGLLILEVKELKLDNFWKTLYFILDQIEEWTVDWKVYFKIGASNLVSLK